MVLLLDRLASTRKRITMAEGLVEISDVAIWFKHVEPPELQRRLKSLRLDEIITLEIDGVRGEYQRMRDGKDGRKSDGMKPVGAIREIWFDLYHTRKEEFVKIKEVVDHKG